MRARLFRWTRTVLVVGVLLLLTSPILLRLVPVPQEALHPRFSRSYEIVDRHGSVLREVWPGRGECWHPAAVGSSSYAALAMLAAEDHRFHQHGGVDWRATARALVRDIQARAMKEGASTITQQLVANTVDVASDGAAGDSGTARRLLRKLFQALQAMRLETVASKEEILQRYLDTVPYGHHAIGVEAASRLYFDRSAAQVSLAQAAWLAAIPRAPDLYDPWRNPERLRARQKWILDRMLECRFIDQGAWNQAVAEEVRVEGARERFLAPHFVDWVLAGRGASSRSEPRLVTTLDLPLQREAESVVRRQVASLRGRSVSSGALVVLDNETGDVLAMVGSADYSDSDHDGQVNAALALRQPGSTLKPFTYGIALERGRCGADLVADLPVRYPTPTGEFVPVNYDETFHGPVRLRTALACSYNVPAVRTLHDVGVEALLERLKKAGFTSLTRPASFYGLGLTLGNGEVTLLELARAYRGLARGGLAGSERRVLGGSPGEGTPTRFFDAPVADVLTDILSDRHARAPAFGDGPPLALPFPCAVKTGTSRDFRDNWTVGYTTRYTVATWVGNMGAEPMRDVPGVAGAAPIFREVMLYLHRREPPEPFRSPEGLERHRVCARSGGLAVSACPGTVLEWLWLSHKRERCRMHRRVAGRVVEVPLPEYGAWAQHPTLPTRPAGPRSGRNVDLGIDVPSRDDVFILDPDTPQALQQLTLVARVPEGTPSVLWSLDGRSLGRVVAPYTFHVRLVRGRHCVTVQAENGKKATVSFTVR